jgi:hypothetical protein
MEMNLHHWMWLLAFDGQQQDILRTEYETYRYLWSKGILGGLATTLGFFDDTEDGPCALVMLYVSDSLLGQPERILSVSDWYVSGTRTCFWYSYTKFASFCKQ